MKTHRFLLSVSIDEFNCLHSSGFLRVDGNRLVAASSQSASEEVVVSLVAKMPEFMDSDEHAVLVLAFDLSDSGRLRPLPASKTPDFRYVLSAEDCRKVIPLTSLAKSLLEGRLGNQIVLSEPVFEAEMVALFKDRMRMRSLQGADALVMSLVDAAGHSVSEGLPERAASPQPNGFDAVGRALDFTRTKPMVREPISGLRDLGGILLEGLPGKTPDSLLSELRGWLMSRQETLSGFAKVYGDSGLIDLLGRLADKHELPTHGASLAIFLHWRELALKAGGLDLDALEKDCRELSGCVPGSVLVDALWLLGFNAGFETFASAYYERLAGQHPFAAKRKNYQPMALLWPASRPVRQEVPEVPKLANELDEKREVGNSVQANPEETGKDSAAPSTGSEVPHEDKPDIPPTDPPARDEPSGTDNTSNPTAEDSETTKPEADTSKTGTTKAKKPASTKKRATATKKPKTKSDQDSGSEPTLL
jgi:hypothetical protein